MECKVEKFQQNPVSTSPENGDQQLIYKFRSAYVYVCCLCAVCVCAFVMCICVCVCLSVIVINNESRLTGNTSSDKNDVALNVYPDESQLSISINGKTADVTKISFDTTMEGISIIISCHDHNLSTDHELLPAREARSSITILVISVAMSNPLHIVLGDTPYVTASITQVQGYFDDNAHHVILNSNGQGLHYLSDDSNTYYVGIDSNGNIQVQLESEFDSADMHTFKQEHVTNDHMRYCLETGGNKYYLMVGSDGNIITLNANDLVLGSQNDTLSRFRIEQY